MGLDIYLFRCEKTDFAKNSIITHQDLEEVSANAYSKKEYDGLPKAMRDVCQLQKVKSEYYNMSKILTDHGYDENAEAHITGLGGGNTHITVYLKDDKTASIDIDDKTMMEKYIFSQINKRYVCKLEEVDYQRKGLNDTGWSLLPDNCQYSDDKENVIKMTEEGGLSKSFVRNWEDGKTVFMAWW